MSFPTRCRVLEPLADVGCFHLPEAGAASLFFLSLVRVSFCDFEAKCSQAFTVFLGLLDACFPQLFLLAIQDIESTRSATNTFEDWQESVKRVLDDLKRLSEANQLTLDSDPSSSSGSGMIEEASGNGEEIGSPRSLQMNELPTIIEEGEADADGEEGHAAPGSARKPIFDP